MRGMYEGYRRADEARRNAFIAAAKHFADEEQELKTHPEEFEFEAVEKTSEGEMIGFIKRRKK